MSHPAAPAHPEPPGIGAHDADPARGLPLGPMRLAWDTSPALIAVVTGPDHVLAYQNAASAASFGRRPLGLPLAEAFPELSGRSFDALAEVLATGRVIEIGPRTVGLSDRTGDEVLLRYVLAPVGDQPPYAGVVMTAIDVTAESRSQQAAGRAQLLARLGERMSAAGSPEAALQALTAELVPAIADVAAVFIIPAAPGSTSGGQPVAITIARDLLDRLGPPPPSGPRDGPSPWDAALAAGRLVLIDPGDPVATNGPDTPSAQWLAAALTRNIAVVPLAVAGELTGAVVLLAAGERPAYAPADEPFLVEVASRAGAAVAQQRHAAAQRDITLRVQRSLLPSLPTALPGLEAAARYVAGSADAEVGGDWWDLHHLGGGRVGLGVGDVSGRGVPAAVVMGQARAGMRAAAHADLSPVDVLTVLDAQVTELVRIDDSDPVALPPRFATAVYAVLDPFDDTLRVANAGHPPLLVRPPSGAVMRVLAPPGPPLGVGGSDYEDLVVHVPPGSLVVAYTDGLVETRTRHVDDGVDELAQRLASLPADAAVDAIADDLLALADGSDDTALVVLRYLPPQGEVVRLQRQVTTLDEIAEVRRLVREGAHEYAPAETEAAAVVVTELLTNALVHAGPTARLRVLVTADRVLLEVSDSSALRPRQRLAGIDEEGGRGLALVDACASDWGFRVTREGKSTWAELHRGPDLRVRRRP